jgi:hypothetical protein
MKIMSRKPKIVVRLAGGLGNQLFQWACGYALSERVGGTLILDSTSGFVLDFKYRRFFELGALKLNYQKAGVWTIALMYFRWILQRLRLRAQTVRSAFYIEVSNEYVQEVHEHPKNLNAWLLGYFQSPKYFIDFAEQIRTQLLLKEPSYWLYKELGSKMRQNPSVAIGIRLYEETKNPSYHAHLGQEITLAKIQGAINDMADRIGSFDAYVFCTYHAEFLDKLDVPGRIKFISSDDGYSDTWSSLWLLTQCRHHIISNSSFYWWGAFLSAYYHPNEAQHIMASNNFANQAIYLDSWDQF